MQKILLESSFIKGKADGTEIHVNPDGMIFERLKKCRFGSVRLNLNDIMKRFVQVFCLVSVCALMLTACSAQRGASSPTASSWKNGAKGVWNLRSIDKENFPQGSSVKTIFDEAPIDCFLGSEWNLTGSGKGTVTFSQEGSSCAPGAVRQIFWSIYKETDMPGAYFQFKKIMPGDKARDVTAGYRLELVSAMDGTMVMRMPLDAGGSTTSFLVFTFTQ